MEYNRGIVTERAKGRWAVEEIRVMALLEAEARLRNVRFMNQHLVEVVPGRTLEAIKGRRRDPAYRDQVEEFVRELSREEIPRAADEPTAAAPLSPREAGAVVESLPDTIERLAREIDWEALGDRADGLRALINGCRRQCITVPLLQWIRDSLPPPIPLRGRNATPARRVPEPEISRRDKRRREYRQVQGLYQKSVKLCAERILDGAVAPPEMEASNEEFHEYWRGLFEEPVQEYTAPEFIGDHARAHAQLWDPITSTEIDRIRVANGKAPGPDCILPRDWNKIQPPIVAILFNCLMTDGDLPEGLHGSRTIFIPKSVPDNRAPRPSDFRPLSISSVIVRHFHKILSFRLGSVEGLLSDEQRAFRRKVDGVAENLCVLNTLLKEARSRIKTLHVATLDVSKAFDTVNHEGIFDACRRAGVPEDMVKYLKNVYANAYTDLALPCGRHAQSLRVKPTRGVRQGDPLSPALFSLVLDRVFATLSRDVGFRVRDEQVSWLAFADDVALCASTQIGLQRNLDRVSSGLACYGMRLNPAKCNVLSMVASGRDKKIKIVENQLFSIEGARIHQCAVLDLWGYLGVKFVGPRLDGVRVSLSAELDRLRKAPLKPQQRLRMLRDHLLPRHTYAWVLGRVTAAYLRRLDITVRQAVRSWLHLPKDVCTGYYHAPVKEGGLGIPQLSVFIPHLRLKRALALRRSPVPHVVACATSVSSDIEIAWCRARLADIATPESGDSVRRYWAQQLHRSVDGGALAKSASCRWSSEWLRGPADFMSGADFVHANWVRCNALSCGMRSSRGRRHGANVVMCRAGCQESETAGHIIQKCHRTHGGRILRHNAIARSVGSSLERKGWLVQYERLYETQEGLRKPDITAYKDGRYAIVDAQVVSAEDLDRAHFAKVAKYRDIAGLAEILLQEPGPAQGGARRRAVTRVTFSSVTVSWRGVMSPQSASELEALGVDRPTLRRVPTMALQGSYLNWVRWNSMT